MILILTTTHPLKGDKMSQNKRINRYAGVNDVAISIKFDMDELEELMDYREEISSRIGLE